MRKTVFIVFYLLAFTASAALGQSRGADFMPRWVDNQERAVENIVQLDFTESSVRVMEGPSGTRRVRSEVRITGKPGGRRWERKVVLMEVDGKAVPEGRPDIMERHKRTESGRQAESLLESLTLPHTLFGSMSVSGRGVPDMVNGVPVWRFELNARDDTPPRIERATVYFDRNRPQLIRSVVSFRRSSNDQPTLVTTDYVRISGVDVPQKRVSKGTFRTQRRSRRYTVEMNIESRYSDYQLQAR